MKNRHILIIFIMAMIVVIIGAVFKVMHWPGAGSMLVLGMLGQAFALLLLIIKVLRDRNKNHFLNK